MKQSKTTKNGFPFCQTHKPTIMLFLYLFFRNVYKSNQQKYLKRSIVQWDRFIIQYLNIIGYRYSIDVCILFFPMESSPWPYDFIDRCNVILVTISASFHAIPK